MINLRYSKIIFINIITATLISLGASADDPGKSQTAAAYLWIGPSPRAVALGNSFVGIADDVSAICYNPGGIAQVQGHQFMFGSSEMGLDRTYNYASYVYSFEKQKKQGLGSYTGSSIFGNRKRLLYPAEYRWIGIGIAWINFGVKDIAGYDDFGNAQESFSDMENAYMFTYALNLYENFFTGVNFKVYNQTLDNGKASGFGLDLGALYRNPFKRLSYGISVQNLIGSLKWRVPNDITQEDDEYKDKISMCIKAGMAYTIFKMSSFLLDIEHTAKQDITWHTGLELKLSQRNALRFGMDRLNPTAGFGMGFGGNTFDLSIDYAFVFDQESLYNTHRLALKTKFSHYNPNIKF